MLLPPPVSWGKSGMVNNFFTLYTEHQSLRAVPPDSSPRSCEQERPLSFDSSAFLNISLSRLYPLGQMTCFRAGKHTWYQPTGLAVPNFIFSLACLSWLSVCLSYLPLPALPTFLQFKRILEVLSAARKSLEGEPILNPVFFLCLSQKETTKETSHCPTQVR